MDVPAAAAQDPAERRWRIAWAVLLAALAVWGVALGLRGRGTDFEIYLRTGARFLRGEGLYPASDGAWIFKYAPAAGWWFAPIAALPARIAVAVWNLVTVGAVALTASLLSRLSPARSRRAAVLATLALGQSLFLVLFYGQVDAVLLALLVLSAALTERRPALAGVALAMAVLLKPPAALVGIYPLIRRRFDVIGWALLAGVLLWIPVLARYGISGTVAQVHAWSATLSQTTPPWVTGYNTQGLPSLLLALRYGPFAVPPSWAIALAQVVALAVFALLLAWARPSPARAFAWLCAGAVLLSPLAWRANFVLVWPLLALTVAEGDRFGLSMVALFAAVEWLVGESVLGPARLQSVLLVRPFLIPLLALLVSEPARRTRRVSPGTPPVDT